MKVNEDAQLEFSSGKTLWHTIVGIDDDGEVTLGFDSRYADVGLSPEEKRELADCMIARWREYKANIPPTK